MKVVIIGGVAGGATAATRLRRLDETAEIVMFERGSYISFANCGLPYYLGGEIKNEASLTIVTPDVFRDRFNVDVRTECNVISIDRQDKSVAVRDLKKGVEYRERYDKLIIATGAAPIKPPLPGIDLPGVFTLRTIPDTNAIKKYISDNESKRAVVVGGGYIGIELAENLKKAGMDVTVVELTDHLIVPLDYEMAAAVHNHLREKGVGIVLEDGVKSIEKTDSGLSAVLGKSALDADIVIIAVGVRPDTALAKECGLDLDKRGCIVVNKNMRTSDPDIYAAGDSVQVENFVLKSPAFIPLGSPANKQGRIAADNICGIASEYGGTHGTAILRVFDMTVACTGINERDAIREKITYDKVYFLHPSHARYFPGWNEMLVKVIFDTENGKILGAQITGFDGVDKRCDIFAAAIRFGANASDLTGLELCYAPPYGSAKELANFAGYAIENLMTGKVKQFHWHDVDSLPRDGSVTLIDVRNDMEAAPGSIEGFVRIPLERLRGEIDKLDKSKPVYVHCKSGMKSYVACRILSGHGFDCRSLAGGFTLYNSVAADRRDKS